MKYIFFCFAVISFLACTNILKNNIVSVLANYDLSKPEFTVTLPEQLNEVSGIAIISDEELACIQDENGLIFFYNLNSKKISRTIEFAGDGDFEAICKCETSLFVLRSDGILFEVTNFSKNDYEVNSYITAITAENNEGLCYDKKGNRLLIACKSKIGKGSEFKDIRAVYSFDLENKILSSEPVYSFSVVQVQELADNLGIKMPEKKTKKGVKEGKIKFRPSAINIHPKTGEIYILSAVDHLILVFDYDGNPKNIAQLDSKMFRKPEGIDFFVNGDMIISNEAVEHQPVLLKFEYLTKKSKQ